MLTWAVLLIMVLIGFLTEMMTYSIRDTGGLIIRFFRTHKIFLACAIGAIAGALMMWKGNGPVFIVGIALFAASVIYLIVRVEKQPDASYTAPQRE